MFFTCPNGSVINTMYIEFVSPIQYVEPTEENKLDQPLYAFFVRTMGGYSIGFEEADQGNAEYIRNELLTGCNSQ